MSETRFSVLKRNPKDACWTSGDAAAAPPSPGSTGAGYPLGGGRGVRAGRCHTCGIALAEPYGWCAGCRAAYCFPCGRRHFCTPSCPANGCLAGLCVRLVEGGVLSETWGLPDEG